MGVVQITNCEAISDLLKGLPDAAAVTSIFDIMAGAALGRQDNPRS